MKESKTGQKLSLPDFMLKEAESTYRMFRDDLVKIQDAMTAREKKMAAIKAEQVIDLQKKLKIEGALAVCKHLETKFKEAWVQERDKKQAKRRVRKTVNG